jgi:DnaK suppressor protein
MTEKTKRASAAKSAKKKSAGSVPTARGKSGAKTAVSAESLVVLPGEDLWTTEEVAEVREFLQNESQRLRDEIAEAEADIAGLLRDSNDVGGEDQADTGSKTFSREHEMSLAASHREMLAQTERALSNIALGTYGICDSCGNPIGKARLQAFPRATLCMTCKQREERR